jgi:uncharacterized RDD family membrane protein YckC
VKAWTAESLAVLEGDAMMELVFYVARWLVSCGSVIFVGNFLYNSIAPVSDTDGLLILVASLLVGILFAILTLNRSE